MPCFVFPGERPNYVTDFKNTSLLLESLDNEDMCLIGTIRVNMDRLQTVVGSRKRVNVATQYTTDEWTTFKQTKAMMVKAQSHPDLLHLSTKAMRFYIDCDEFEIGDILKFSVICYANDRPNLSLGKDDNFGKYYQVNCMSNV